MVGDPCKKQGCDKTVTVIDQAYCSKEHAPLAHLSNKEPEPEPVRVTVPVFRTIRAIPGIKSVRKPPTPQPTRPNAVADPIGVIDGALIDLSRVLRSLSERVASGQLAPGLMEASNACAASIERLVRLRVEVAKKLGTATHSDVTND